MGDMTTERTVKRYQEARLDWRQTLHDTKAFSATVWFCVENGWENFNWLYMRTRQIVIHVVLSGARISTRERERYFVWKKKLVVIPNS